MSTTSFVFPDADGDGFTSDEDCDDTNDEINPDAEEICGDGIDQNCDGFDEDCTPTVDNDGDGYTGNDGDCNDTNASVHPGATEICGDGIDQDCDGSDAYCYKLNFPHIASNSTWETEICIINNSAEQSLSGDFKAYNNSGQEVSSTPVILASNGRRKIIIGDELPNPSGIGYIIFESNSENVVGYTKFYIKGKYRVAVPATSDVNAGDIYISHIASNADWWTGISILNTTSSSKKLTVEFDNGTTKPITIAAKEHKAFTISSLFGDVPQPDINSAVIKNGSGIVGLELFGSTDNSGNNYLSGILLKDETTTNIYYPHIASNSTWWTGIVAYNPSAASCNLTITPFSESGTSLTPQTIPLAGKEKYIGLVQNLNFPDGTAWFKIDASSPIIGFELFGTNDGNQLGGYTGVGISGTNGVFAKIEKDGWTGIAFVNIENSPATVTITAYDDSSSVIATETLNINAYEKVVDMAPNLFSQDISNATYIGYSSNRELVGFQLNGSSDNMMLDALPGINSVLLTCTDADFDGYYSESDCGSLVDCNDYDASIYPGATEICDDTIDQDCNGSDEICSKPTGATLEVTNDFYLTQKIYLDGTYIGSVSFGQKVSFSIPTGYHTWKACDDSFGCLTGSFSVTLGGTYPIRIYPS